MGPPHRRRRGDGGRWLSGPSGQGRRHRRHSGRDAGVGHLPRRHAGSGRPAAGQRRPCAVRGRPGRQRAHGAEAGLRIGRPDPLRRHAVPPRYRLARLETLSAPNAALRRSRADGNDAINPALSQKRATGYNRPSVFYPPRAMSSSPSPTAVKAYLLDLQNSIVAALEALDGKAFLRDAWERPDVGGAALPPSASAHRPELGGQPWQAMGVSLVLHPRNPHAPTVHMNVRFFTTTTADGTPVWWFGGGMDLTPYYGYAEDARHFHQACRDAVAPFGDELHPRFKQWCDEYFYLKHRKEARGVGGIFFDDYNAAGFEQSFAMMRSVGDAFVTAYLPLLERRKDMQYGERERDFQAYRRGRYVEFNLIFDRGTLFGLQSGAGRTEAILMSMPPIVKWRYDWRPEDGTPEASLYTDFLPHRDWLAT